jgi:hypothetical protein
MCRALDADMPGMSLRRRANRILGPDTVEVATSEWIRNRRRTRVWAGLAVLWSVVFACLMFIPGNLSTAGYVALGALYFGIAGLGLVFARRVATAGVWIGPEGIVVRGPFRTQSVRLADAQAFVPGLQGGAGNGTPCPTLKRRGGRAVGVWALGRRNIVFRYQRLFGEIQPLCDELNELLTAVQSAAPLGPPARDLSPS